MWTARQRIALCLILSILLLILVVRYLRNPTFVDDPQPAEGSRAAELADRIDPNLADAATLSALPTLGEKRARLIIDYRDRFHKMFPSGGEPFQQPEDLLRIRGIGGATLDQMRPFLKFPVASPTTTPSTGPTTRDED